MSDDKIIELETFISNIGKHYRIKDLEDYKQEVLLILLEKDKEVIKRIYKEGKLKNYVYKICVTQVLSINSPFYIKYIYPKTFKELNGTEVYIEKEFKEEKIKELINSLKGIDKMLLIQLIKCRGNKKSFSIKSNISYSSINLMIHNMSEKIKRNWSLTDFYE